MCLQVQGTWVTLNRLRSPLIEQMRSCVAFLFTHDKPKWHRAPIQKNYLKKRIIKIGTCSTMILKFDAKKNKIDNPERETQI